MGNDDQDLSALAAEIQRLDAEVFEVTDYTEPSDMLAIPSTQCSTWSCSTTSCSSACCG